MKIKKIVTIALIPMTCICLALGIVGLLNSKKNNKPVNIEKNYQITYKYYLNDVEVAQLPTNPTFISSEEEQSSIQTENDVEKLYAFNTYSCTNNVTGTWDDETWSFKHSNTADATCSLYFVTTYNTLKVELTNAKFNSDKDKEQKVNRGEDAVIKLIPNEGYQFEKGECSNNEVVDWDKDAKELIIRSITAETTCKINFVISKFTIETEVNYGTGTTSVEYEYGKKVDINVEPATEYGNPEIKCTNDQKGVWNNNVFTIEKLTNNTKCVITFIKLQSKIQFTATLEVGQNGSIISGSSSQLVLSGGYVSWNVQPNEGYTIKTDPSCTAGKPTVSSSGNAFIITLKDIDKDATCTVIYEKVTASPTLEE